MTTIKRLDHVNILTADLPGMTAWYADILDLNAGHRPPFSTPGAWLYCDGIPCVHLVEIDAAQNTQELQIEHFAFAATGLPDFLSKLEDRGIGYSVDKVPETPLVQINIADADGNHIHVDFASEELPSKN